MATTSPGGIEKPTDCDSSGEHQPPRIAKVSSLPPMLTLRSKRKVLKAPTLDDDVVMCEIVSDPRNVQYLPHFHRPGGWTLEEMSQRREKLLAAQGENKGLTLFLHMIGNKGKDGNKDFTNPAEDVENLTLAGTTGFSSVDLQSGTCEIGIILHHPYWRKGIATEALYLCLRYVFGTLGLQRVDWFTSVSNKDMRGWCENFIQMKPFDVMLDNLGSSVGYSLSLLEWESRISHLLEQKVFSRNS